MRALLDRVLYELRPGSNPVMYAVAAVWAVASVAGWVDPSASGIELEPGFDPANAAGLLVTALVGYFTRNRVYTRRNVEGDRVDNPEAK